MTFWYCWCAGCGTGALGTGAWTTDWKSGQETAMDMLDGAGAAVGGGGGGMALLAALVVVAVAGC